MDRDLALNIIREQRIRTDRSYRLTKPNACMNLVDSKTKRNSLTTSTAGCRLEDELFYKRMQEINHWSSL